MTTYDMKRMKKSLARLGALGLIVGAVACDTDVVNPGPIDEQFLSDPAAQGALVNGAGRAVGDALNWIAYTSAAVAREVHPSGSTGSFGITPKQQAGYLEDNEIGTQWENAYRARYMANTAIERITGLDPADQDQDQLAQAYLWAGYAARILGESMCQAVFDGGPAESSDGHLTEAIANFDQAEALGSGDVQIAARAGRASANVMLGNWAAAVADAATVPVGFSYVMPYFNLGDDAQANRIYVAGKATPYKAHSQIFTWIAEYNPETGGVADTDPRVSWIVSGENGDADTSCCGPVAWNPQTKYASDDAAIELSSYEEMQLILAENELINNNDIGAGTDIINALRTAAGVATVPVESTVADAMTWLKREHAIEMWLEGRRLPALRRWEENGTPGDLQPLEQVGDGNPATGSHLETRDFCFPISEAERDTNPNIS